MKRSLMLRLAMVLAGIIILVYSCKHQPPILNYTDPGSGGGGVVPPASTCSADTVYFANQVMPLIASNCNMAGCHDNITHADGVNLTNYNNIMRYIVPGNASESKLYRMVVRTDGDRMPPPPAPPLTSAQIALLQKWISQGAKNNSCSGGCDTASFTYSAAIKIIMENKCRGCHNPANAGGNIDLSSYAGVKVVAQNGKLYGSIAQLVGYSPMPKGAAKLSDCEIIQVQKWITAGAPNN